MKTAQVRLRFGFVLAALLGMDPSSTERAAAAAGAPAPPGILIEAEDYSSRFPDTNDYAIPSREPAASGRSTLSRFFRPGELRYHFELEKAGRWRIWLRYGSKNPVTLGTRIDPGETARLKATKLPATGGYIGPDVWDWAKIFDGELTAGSHTLAIGHASMRPDCFVVTRSDETPTDAVIRLQSETAIDPALRPLLERPLEPPRPDWLDEAAGYRLPEWFEAHRVQLHTRLSLTWLKRKPETFLKAGSLFRSLGAKTFTRHIKTGGEGAWWPSRFGAVSSATADRNLGKEIIDEAHAAGTRALIYHRHMEDDALAKEHPDWVSLDWRDKPYVKRGVKLCFNSPYADFVERRLLELVDLGADGFYFDEVHMEKWGCWCRWCQEGFTRETGLPFPERKDPQDPLWRKLSDFTNVSVERVFRKWRRAIHDRNPEVVMLIGSHTWPAMTERHLTQRLFRIADSMKTEFNLAARNPSNGLFPLPPDLEPIDPDVKIALGYAMSRDACDGRPAHVWVHGLRDETSARFAAAGVMTHGCIANLDAPENAIPDPMFKPALALGEKVSPWFVGARPVRWATVHYPELARDSHVIDGKAWEKVLYPFYGSWLALHQARLPAGVITDSQLEEGPPAGCEVLVLPAPDSLTPAMRASVARFEARGGAVVRQRAEWRWHEPDGGQEQAIAAFLEEIQPKARVAPMRILGGPKRLHSTLFKNANGRTTIALANEFAWTPTGRHKPGKPSEATPPPPCRDVRILLPKAPAKAVEIVTGRKLTIRATPEGASIALPEFDAMAVVTLD